MVDGVLLRRAESEDTWAMGVIETACWRVGYAGVLPQHVLESLDESIRAKDGSGSFDVRAVKRGLRKIWKVGCWALRPLVCPAKSGKTSQMPKTSTGCAPCLSLRHTGVWAWEANF